MAKENDVLAGPMARRQQVLVFVEQKCVSSLSLPSHPHGVASLGPQACETYDRRFWTAGWGWGGTDRPASPSLLEWGPVCIPDSLLPPCGCRASCRHTAVRAGVCLLRAGGLRKTGAEAELEIHFLCQFWRDLRQGSLCPHPRCGHTSNTGTTVTPTGGHLLSKNLKKMGL